MTVYNSKFEIVALVNELKKLKEKAFLYANDLMRSDVDRARSEGFVSAYDFAIMRLTQFPHRNDAGYWECDSENSPNGLCLEKLDGLYCAYCNEPMDERK